jgi:hypothetical protein
VPDLYSALLLSGLADADGVSATVPDGYIWVVRDAVLIPGGGGSAYTPLSGCVLDTLTALPIFAVLQCISGKTYHWRGRQVVGPDDGLICSSTDDPPWTCRVSGYQLSLP